MSTHARNPSIVSDSGSESSLTSLSSSDAQQPTQPPAPPPSAQPVRARNPSVISKAGSESSLTTLSSSDESERLGPEPRVPRPQTPNTRNATGIPDLTFSPSSVLSSPESTRSYGFSAVENYPGVGNVVKGILESQAPEHEVKSLYAQAQKHLAIFDNPLYTPLDIPEWVSRVSPHGAMQPMIRGFTVRKLIKTMYDTAEDLGLEDGKKYVAAAVCSCAIQAKDAEDRNADLAHRLQALASTWAAFFLWPFFSQQHNTILSADDISLNATPTRSETASLMDQGLSKHRDSDLREKVLKRDGQRCILTGHLERLEYERLVVENGNLPLPGEPVRAERLEVAHIFKRALAVYSSSSSDAKEKEKFRSTAITVEILRHYCKLSPKYLNDMDLMDRPENAMSLIRHYHTNFDEFLWCLKPTETPNCYEVKDYDSVTNYMYMFDVPKHITFKDHTVDDAIVAAPGSSEPSGSRTKRPPKRPHEAVGEALPDQELLRLHAALTGVLRMSGAAGVFKLIMERRGPGNPPVPSADGKAFMKEIIDPELPSLREAVAGMQIADSE